MFIQIIFTILALLGMIVITWFMHYIINPYFVDITSQLNNADVSQTIGILSWGVSLIPAIIILAVMGFMYQKMIN